MNRILSEYIFSDMVIQYLHVSNGSIGLICFPTSMADQVCLNTKIDPVVQIRISGDDFLDGFSNGETLRNGSTIQRFKYDSQHQEITNEQTCIHTIMKSEDGLYLIHHLSYRAGNLSIMLWSSFKNVSTNAVTLELLSSFSVGGITPFSSDDANEQIFLHRFRSHWSAEARHDEQMLETIDLVPSWSGYGVRCERYGQRGSMPVRGYFPWIGVEDRKSGVLWCAHLHIPGSWQMEAVRRDCGLNLSGGLADFDFGHWKKVIQPGEYFVSPPARLTTAKDTFDCCCQRLVHDLVCLKPQAELPIIFNEFCTSWGTPSQQSISNLLESIGTYDIDYFVIDAGWYADDVMGWGATMGDWVANKKQFPMGLGEAVRLIRQSGLKPGIWFELECCGLDAQAFHQVSHMLKRDGKVITVGKRRFWDMRDAWTQNYLEERVIGTLKTYGFEYLKIDYNDSIGIGCDGAESLGEGLRQHLEATQDFIRRIKAELPDIVIENCSSGGHRLEPSMLSICEYASFSDAHEQREIPIIAANLHRLIPPGQSEIWAVLRKEDSVQRLIYSLTATMLGVMCLSGDIKDLYAEQQKTVAQAIQFFRYASKGMITGESQIYQSIGASWRHPHGWQAVLRENSSRSRALLIVHVFQLLQNDPLCYHIPQGYRVTCVLSGGSMPEVSDNDIYIPQIDFSGYAFILKKNIR